MNIFQPPWGSHLGWFFHISPFIKGWTFPKASQRRGFQLWFGLTSVVEVMGPPEWSLLDDWLTGLWGSGGWYVCGEENSRNSRCLVYRWCQIGFQLSKLDFRCLHAFMKWRLNQTFVWCFFSEKMESAWTDDAKKWHDRLDFSWVWTVWSKDSEHLNCDVLLWDCLELFLQMYDLYVT